MELRGRELARHVLLLVVLMLAALYGVAHAAIMIAEFGVGWDSHAYWSARGDALYDIPPGHLDAYNYSPVFAQVLAPLTHLPWPVFRALFLVAPAAALVWLCWPMPVVLRVLALAACSVQVTSGNVDWVVALVLVLGLGRGWPWVFPALTKVTQCLGPVWFLARGEWRRLAEAGVALLLVVGVSYAWAPHLWHEWFAFLAEHSGSRPGMVQNLLPPLWLRVLAALGLTVVAARTDRAWLLPFALVVAAPVPGTGSWALLAAVPRLRARARRESGDLAVATQ